MDQIEETKLKRLLLDVNLELHNEVKKRAAERGISLKVWLKRAIMAQIKKEEQYE